MIYLIVDSCNRGQCTSSEDKIVGTKLQQHYRPKVVDELDGVKGSLAQVVEPVVELAVEPIVGLVVELTVEPVVKSFMVQPIA